MFCGSGDRQRWRLVHRNFGPCMSTYYNPHQRQFTSCKPYRWWISHPLVARKNMMIGWYMYNKAQCFSSTNYVELHQIGDCSKEGSDMAGNATMEKVHAKTIELLMAMQQSKQMVRGKWDEKANNNTVRMGIDFLTCRNCTIQCYHNCIAYQCYNYAEKN